MASVATVLLLIVIAGPLVATESTTTTTTSTTEQLQQQDQIHYFVPTGAAEQFGSIVFALGCSYCVLPTFQCIARPHQTQQGWRYVAF